jgi:hypothetical protein
MAWNSKDYNPGAVIRDIHGDSWVKLQTGENWYNVRNEEVRGAHLMRPAAWYDVPAKARRAASSRPQDVAILNLHKRVEEVASKIIELYALVDNINERLARLAGD